MKTVFPLEKIIIKKLHEARPLHALFVVHTPCKLVVVQRYTIQPTLFETVLFFFFLKLYCSTCYITMLRNQAKKVNKYGRVQG